jgi:hypothetical protein
MRDLLLGLTTLAVCSVLAAGISLALSLEPVRYLASAGLALVALAAFVRRRAG